jgi:hypothetical protein
MLILETTAVHKKTNKVMSRLAKLTRPVRQKGIMGIIKTKRAVPKNPSSQYHRRYHLLSGQALDPKNKLTDTKRPYKRRVNERAKM